jgi:hypothetical protein
VNSCLCAVSPFTIAVIPDTQFYSESYPDQFLAQTQWIVDNRAAEGIVLVSHVGDVVQNGGQGNARNAEEWNHADAAMSILDVQTPDLPYGVVAGNHDYDLVNNQVSADQYVQYFGASRYSERKWYGGCSPDQMNHYQRFTAGGRDYLHIALEWQPHPSSLDWVQSVLDDNPDVPAIISTHEYSLPSGSRSRPTGQEIYKNLVENNSQVFMVLSGHATEEGRRTATNAAGLEVFEMLANYQTRRRGGDGWMRLIEFDEANNQINVKTYSPTLDKFEVDSNSHFSLNVNFDSRFGVVPEPSTFVLTLAGLFGIISHGRRRMG